MKGQLDIKRKREREKERERERDIYSISGVERMPQWGKLSRLKVDILPTVKWEIFASSNWCKTIQRRA
jgi:hypothetical protein